MRCWAETVALSDETHKRYADTQRRLGDLGRSFRNAGTEASSAFLPVMEDVLNVLVPIIRGFARFAEQNPNVVRALAAIGIGLGAVTIALWLANTAATFFAAITGVGLPLIAGAAIAAGAVAAAGGVAFTLGGGFGGAGASSTEQQEAAQEEAEERQRANANSNSDKVVGAVGALALRNEAVFERSRQELDPILRAIDCLESAAAAEPATPAAPEASPVMPTSVRQGATPIALPSPLDPADAIRNERAAIQEAYRLSLRSRLTPSDAHDRLLSSQDIFTYDQPRPDNYRPGAAPVAFPVSTSAPNEVNVTNNFYETPDPAGEIVRETEAAITRVNSRR